MIRYNKEAVDTTFYIKAKQANITSNRKTRPVIETGRAALSSSSLGKQMVDVPLCQSNKSKRVVADNDRNETVDWCNNA